VDYDDWFLTAQQRDNPDTVLDSRHEGGAAWSSGNEVRALIHGATYFAELRRHIAGLERGDLLLFTDWRGDPDQQLDDGPGHDIATALADAARRGVVVKALVWRSHWDRLAFSAQENRHLGEDIEAAGGECLLDMRVRTGGSHHQKFAVLRHRGRPELDVAFVGGIDLCHSRRDDEQHHGDAQRQPMAAVYGERPPWHDAQAQIRGPAVGDVEAVFRERWNDPAPLARNPLYRIGELVRGEDTHTDPLPAQLPDPAPRGSCAVQLLRTYPYRKRGYPFASRGERSVARGYQKAISRARRLIYLEDQYFWGAEIVRSFADALAAHDELHLIVVIPHYPDQEGWTMPPNLIGRQDALREIRAAGGDRVAVYGLENHAGVPVYVHAKVCILDDVWASIGSDNVNRRSWTHDSELTCAVIDDAGQFPRELRLALAREHLDRPADPDRTGDGQPGDADLLDPAGLFAAFAESAARLQQWHRDGCAGPRPPGRLRPYDPPGLGSRTRLWARPLYRAIYDPDGRPRRLRREHRF
jgi:phosphatidylserine/phosphatidylglycerophosphate/cardiolipin synthase-like enzyme